METVFDHNITDEEFAMVIPYGRSKEFYLSYITQDSAYMHIAHLYYIREDSKKMVVYGLRIKKSLRNSFFRTIGHSEYGRKILEKHIYLFKLYEITSTVQRIYLACKHYL